MDKIVTFDEVYKQYTIYQREGEGLFSLFRRKKILIPAVQGISFSIQRGEIVGYIGENGAGKSTTLKMLVGIMQNSQGNIHLFGENPFKERKKLSKKIGILFGQKSQLWWDLPLMDSFHYLQKIYQVEDFRWLNRLIEALEVQDFLYQPVRQLSLGQRMRGEFICALIHQPDLLLLDEPTIGVDVFTKKKMMELLLQLNQEKELTIIFTSHDLADVEQICTRMILLQDGKINYDGPIEIFKNIFKQYKKLHLYGNHLTLNNTVSIEIVKKNQHSIAIIFDTNRYSSTDLLDQFSLEAQIEKFEVESLSLEEVLDIHRKKEKSS